MVTGDYGASRQPACARPGADADHAHATRNDVILRAVAGSTHRVAQLNKVILYVDGDRLGALHSLGQIKYSHTLNRKTRHDRSPPPRALPGRVPRGPDDLRRARRPRPR